MWSKKIEKRKNLKFKLLQSCSSSSFLFVTLHSEKWGERLLLPLMSSLCLVLALALVFMAHHRLCRQWRVERENEGRREEEKWSKKSFIRRRERKNYKRRVGWLAVAVEWRCEEGKRRSGVEEEDKWWFFLGFFREYVSLCALPNIHSASFSCVRVFTLLKVKLRWRWGPRRRKENE